MSFSAHQRSGASFSTSRHGNSRRNHFQKKTTLSKSHVVPPQRLPEYPVPKELIPVLQSDLKPMPHMTERSKQYLRGLESIKNGIFHTNESNHLHVLELLLYVEELNNDVDVGSYDQFGKSIPCHCLIEKCWEDKISFKIYVDRLTAGTTIYRPEDQIEILDTELKALYILRVTKVLDGYLVAVADARFCQQYSPEKKYGINLRSGDYTFRCCHFALYLIDQFQLTPLLFPVMTGACPEIKYPNFWYNVSIKDDPQQKQAVLRIAHKSSFPAPYILYGPPGTGKTATVIEAICQIWRLNPSQKVLVCTPSNPAADVIAKRLLEYIPGQFIYRMYSLSKDGSSIDEGVVGCSNVVDDQVVMLPNEVVIQKRIVICTLCTATRLIFMRFPETHFSHIFIDEAGQASEPDTLIPFNLSSSSKPGRIGRLHAQIILAGDPQQLGPVIKSKLAEPILGKSMLERLMDCEPYKRNRFWGYDPRYITKLIRNYRSHPLLIKVSNELFYDQELEPHGPDYVIRKAEDWKHLVKSKFPIIFHGVEGTEKKNPRSPSLYNSEEINVVIRYVKLLLESKFKDRKISQHDIGIITPFSEQSRKLLTTLKNNHLGNVEVGTVELFQGREKDVIILSTVRSRTFVHDNKIHIGSLSNLKRFNVALTRAVALLIVVGNPKALQTNENWLHFMKFCHENNACCGSKFEIPGKSKVVEEEKSEEEQRCESIDNVSYVFKCFCYAVFVLVSKIFEVIRDILFPKPSPSDLYPSSYLKNRSYRRD